MARKAVRCFCGFAVEGEDDHIVVALQGHAQEFHQTTLSRDQVLAMAEPLPEG